MDRVGLASTSNKIDFMLKNMIQLILYRKKSNYIYLQFI